MENANDTPLVRLKNLHKRFGEGDTVLENIDLEASGTDFIGLIGPSGCGKSTLLKLISGLTPVTGGKLEVNGGSPAAARDRMSYIFQDATLLPWLTVHKNIQTTMRLHGINKNECIRVADKMAAMVGLEKVVNYYPRQLSGGMQMRVSIARALSVSPQILLLDEPFGALDEMTRDHLNEELLRIRSMESWTAFFVTHSVAEAVFLSTEIIVLTANPGTIYKKIAVDFPYPRTAETRESPEFQRLVGEVSHHLRSVER